MRADLRYAERHGARSIMSRGQDASLTSNEPAAEFTRQETRRPRCQVCSIFPSTSCRTTGAPIPGPADFDAYWEQAQRELAAVDAAVELVPAQFQAPFARCDHLYFTGVGGPRVHAKLLRPAARAAPGPAVLMFHGYRGQSPEWSEMLGYVGRRDHRRGARLPRPGRPLRRCRRRPRQHALRPHHSRPGRRAGAAPVPAHLSRHGAARRHRHGPRRGGRRARGGDRRLPGRRP